MHWVASVNYMGLAMLGLDMVLRCSECGGAVELQAASYPTDTSGHSKGVAFETYECVECGATGTYRFGDRDGQHVDETSGCLTSL